MIKTITTVSLALFFANINPASADFLCPTNPPIQDRTELNVMIWMDKYGAGSVVLRMRDLGMMARIGGFSLNQREALDNELIALLEVIDTFEESFAIHSPNITLRTRSRKWLKSLLNRDSLGLSNLTLRGEDLEKANKSADAVIKQTADALRKLGYCSR